MDYLNIDFNIQSRMIGEKEYQENKGIIRYSTNFIESIFNKFNLFIP